MSGTPSSRSELGEPYSTRRRPPIPTILADTEHNFAFPILSCRLTDVKDAVVLCIAPVHIEHGCITGGGRIIAVRLYHFRTPSEKNRIGNPPAGHLGLLDREAALAGRTRMVLNNCPAK